MDFQYWLYIIIGVLYLLNQFRKKPEQQPNDLPDFKPEKPQKKFEEPSARPTPQKALTFEELLREITESKKVVETKPVAPAREMYENYEEDIEEEAQDLEEEDYDRKKQERTLTIYEDAKREAFYRTSLEDTLKLTDTDMKFGRFKEFDQQDQENLAATFLNDLKHPDGLKRAFVMSEILNRKF